jgi:hypothetical protein
LIEFLASPNAGQTRYRIEKCTVTYLIQRTINYMLKFSTRRGMSFVYTVHPKVNKKHTDAGVLCDNKIKRLDGQLIGMSLVTG